MASTERIPKRPEDVEPNDLKRAVGKLGLSDPDKIAAATQKVEVLVNRLYKLEWWQTVAWDRPARIDYIERIRKHLDDLRKDFERAGPGMKTIFGANLSEPLARVLGPRGVSVLCPELAGHLPLPSGRDFDRFIARRRRGESFEDFNPFARATTTNVLEDHCVDVLSSPIEMIDLPLREMMEFAKANKGGHPFQPYRALVIPEAGQIYRAALGAPPTGQGSGPFVRFCAEILEAVGLPTTGLIAAVGRHLKSLDS